MRRFGRVARCRSELIEINVDLLSLVAERFPEIQLIALDENVGFARANNLAIRATTGRWVLLLNPDTVVQEGDVAYVSCEISSLAAFDAELAASQNGKGH